MATIIFRPSKPGDSTAIPSQYPASGYHWEKVDEVDQDEEYLNSSSRSACLDLFGFDPQVLGGKINSARVYFRVLSQFTNWKYRAAVKTHDTIYYGSDTHNSMNLISETFYAEWLLNPYTSSLWNWSEIYSMQFGVEINGYETEASYGRVHWCYLAVDYTVENVKPGLIDMGMM